MPLDCRTTTNPVTVRYVLRCDGIEPLGSGCPTSAEADLSDKPPLGFSDGHPPAWAPGMWLYFVEHLPDYGGLDVKRCLCPDCAEGYVRSRP